MHGDICSDQAVPMRKRMTNTINLCKILLTLESLPNANMSITTCDIFKISILS